MSVENALTVLTPSTEICPVRFMEVGGTIIITTNASEEITISSMEAGVLYMPPATMITDFVWLGDDGTPKCWMGHIDGKQEVIIKEMMTEGFSLDQIFGFLEL